MTIPDPKVVLQAHALRTRVTRQALLYGSKPARARGGVGRALLIGIVFSALILGVILVVDRLSGALPLK